ncbi:MAG: hypothetical protein HFF48_10130, partial [Lawsonibacter sp.]|nr:hypothetical protein [Lawsonibacter sp.]
YASKGVYTLYNKDGIVIAAVVVGEDDGTARNLVYAHTSDVEWESYNGESSTRADGDGLFTWTRKVISDGQEITLTEVSDGNSDLAAMAQYHWYQIKTNGDGEVTGVYRMPGDKISGTKHDKLDEAKLTRLDDLALDYKVDYVEDEKGVTQGEIAYTIQNGANNILYWNKNYIESNLYMDGRTLYVATDDDYGFIVNSNVKWVVQQWDNNAKETYIDEGTTAAGLDNMIKELNRRNTNREGKIENYHYQVSAIIESGIASSVVIFYNENDYNRPNGGGTTEGVEATVDLTGVLGNAKVYDAKDVEIKGVAIRGGNRFTVKTGDVLTVVDTDIANEKFEAAANPAANAEIKKADGDLKINVKGNVVVNGVIGEEEPGETKTLTLKGGLMAASVEVYTGDASGSPLTGKDVTSAGVKSGVEYKIPAGTKVTINAKGDTGVTTKSVIIDGVVVDMDASVTTDRLVVFTMPDADFTLDTTAATGNVATADTYYEVVVGEGLTVTGAAAGDVIVIDGVTYVKATKTPTVKGGKWIEVADADTKAGTIKNDNAAMGAVSAPAWVLPAYALTLTNATASYDNDGTDTSVTSGNGVAVGTMLKVAASSGGTGVFVNTTDAAGADVSGTTYSYRMPAEDTTLKAGYKLTLNGVTAMVGTLEVKNGWVVGSALTAATAVDTDLAVIETTGGKLGAAAVYTAGALTKDTELSAALALGTLNKVKITQKSTASGLDTPIIADTDTAGYIILGTVIDVKGTDQLVVTDANGDTVDLAEFVEGDNNAVYEAANYWLQLTVTKDIAGWGFDGEA